ncbi:MAG: acetylornithine/succinylornithine family transaminase [Ardenticatenaceae bacterium]|nr:acetylornithine/succinylornithine family transaminase [Ardenticatenaceae bacterium]
MYAKRNVCIVRGEGAYLWDSEGRRYIDCVGGIGSMNVGHANPFVADAICRQARTLMSAPEMFYNDVRAVLVERLVQLVSADLDRVFLCNSGTEAIEAAIKFARMATHRPNIVATTHAFHGRTMGALSATWKAQYREPFEPLVPGFTRVPFNDSEQLAAAIDDQTAAIVLEPVQGQGGIHPVTREFIETTAATARQHGALLILDEVQTGFGRTGKMFAFEHWAIEPDLLCVAKSIAGGVPMGAVLVNARIESFPAGSHGSTFGGNPLACAAALAALDFIESQRLPERAATLGEHFQNALREIASPRIREVRGLGLMIGVELHEKAGPYLSRLQEAGILAANAGEEVLRFLPPLVIEREDLDRVVAVLAELLRMP